MKPREITRFGGLADVQAALRETFISRQCGGRAGRSHTMLNALRTAAVSSA